MTEGYRSRFATQQLHLDNVTRIYPDSFEAERVGRVKRYNESASRRQSSPQGLDGWKNPLQRNRPFVATLYNPDQQQQDHTTISRNPSQNGDMTDKSLSRTHLIPQSPRYTSGKHQQAQNGREEAVDCDVNQNFALISPSRDELHAPVVFGNLHESSSVVTGMSQQELLRHKAREDGRKRRHQNAKSKKSKMYPIVNIPINLSQGLNIRRGHYDKVNSVTGESEHNNHSSNMSRRYKPMTTIIDSGDYREQFTASSAPTGELPRESSSFGANSNNTYGTPSLYSTLPAQQTVLNEADGDTMMLWSTPSKDESMESFPILSNHCGLSLSSFEPKNAFYTPKLNDESGNFVSLAVSKSGLRESITVSGQASRSKRLVRFSHQDSFSSAPWDERDEGQQELKEIENRTTTLQSSNITFSPDSPPKSILRATRFSSSSPGARTSSSYYAQLQAFRNKQSRRAEHKVELLNFKSPPRPESAFSYPTADELSLNATSPLRTKLEDDPFAAEIAENDSQNSSPVPDMFDELDDDEEIGDENETSVVAVASFIQTIAAVVIQAAFRRYRVQWIYSDMLARKNLQRLRQGQQHNNSGPVVFSPVHESKESARVVPCKDAIMTPNGQRARDRVANFSKSNAIGLNNTQGNNHHGFNETNAAATTIQALFRGYWARDCISVDVYCASLVQKTWRSYQVRHAYLFDLYSIILVQSLWRRSLARTQAAVTLYATILAQKAARGYLARKSYRTLKRATSSTVIVNRFLRHHAHRHPQHT
ncbi:hypothetical protein MPSEU_000503700 [Mayamaea pseudoterrestris]|nr:hypothetical protein MPSEU_000503700 [Mayamaea pseudoterrestris]